MHADALLLLASYPSPQQLSMTIFSTTAKTSGDYTSKVLPMSRFVHIVLHCIFYLPFPCLTPKILRCAASSGLSVPNNSLARGDGNYAMAGPRKMGRETEILAGKVLVNEKEIHRRFGSNCDLVRRPLNLINIWGLKQGVGVAAPPRQSGKKGVRHSVFRDSALGPIAKITTPI